MKLKTVCLSMVVAGVMGLAQATEVKSPTQQEQKMQLAFDKVYGENPQVKQDLAGSVKMFGELATAGNVQAMYELGRSYQTERGVQRDLKKAHFWIKKAAEQKYADAQYEMGRFNYYGIGQGVNKKEGLRWFFLALENGSPDAPVDLYDIHKESDPQKAMQWLKLGEERNSEYAKTILDELKTKK